MGTSLPAPLHPPPTPCRVWQGTINDDGYGIRLIKGKRVRVHRWVVAQIDGWGAIKGKVVMHLCDNPGCFRYDHLRIGTVAENLRDMYAKGRNVNHQSRKTHCPQGHPYEGDNLYVKPSGHRVCRTCKRNGETS